MNNDQAFFVFSILKEMVSQNDVNSGNFNCDMDDNKIVLNSFLYGDKNRAVPVSIELELVSLKGVLARMSFDPIIAWKVRVNNVVSHSGKFNADSTFRALVRTLAEVVETLDRQTKKEAQDDFNELKKNFTEIG